MRESGISTCVIKLFREGLYSVSVSYCDFYILRVKVHEGWDKALKVIETHHTDLWMQKPSFFIP